ncbi:hypothetical protein CJD36_003250 [Flavipsychrobacter stenotrophus]|uniref:DUF4142 domain-containing protein n=1 Tax=Flavipsychrobacter stenotrophus TaxID=2077091 RepID=A0A2S7T1H5_9BACT|nr:DUF4142 domain-containing protein [Flavipsychrobacter stenotrophus]PQJ12778.1 hypothetical protein CJD36_003250 [Flavipsychrobacter stenotrophus]
MKSVTKNIIYLFIATVFITSVCSCRGKKYAGTNEEDSDSVILARANNIADSIAKVNYKPDTTYRLDTVKILSNPDYAFVHNCIKSNCKQMEVIHFGIVNGFDKKIKNASKGMMSDYVHLNAQLREYATRNNIPLSNDTTIDLSFANTMDGYTWDSTWVDLVLRDQTATLADFQKAKAVVKDAQLQAMIDNHMPAINKHLQVADNLKKSY